MTTLPCRLRSCRGGRDVINDVVVRPLGPVQRDSDTASIVEQRPGGSAANLASWLGATGASVRFVARVVAGHVTEQRVTLEAFGVECCLVADAEVSIGTIVVIIDGDGGRSMYTDRGASALFQYEMCRPLARQCWRLGGMS